MKLQSVGPVLAVGIYVFLAVPAFGEIKTITATGEYRMGDNDTRADAKQLALRDAKRVALEKAGTYLESVTEVKNFQLSRDEIRTYTAGIIEVVEQTTKSAMEGETTVVRVDVTVNIDTDVVARQIDVLRRNEAATGELTRLREDNDRLRRVAEAKTMELAALKSTAEVEKVSRERQQIMGQADANDLLARAEALLSGPMGVHILGTAGKDSSRQAKQLIAQALSLYPSSTYAHCTMGLV